MPEHRIGLIMRSIAIALLLSGLAAGLTACPEKIGKSPAHERPDSHAPPDHMRDGMMGGGM